MNPLDNVTVVCASVRGWPRWRGPLFQFRVLARVLNFSLSLSFAIVTSAFAMIYKWMPRMRLHRRDFWTGSA